jgi:alkanesulfonate monooxygenase SsuD/methylene tetrahydromethanopterin reductase-like flavin-dependent oxidoreductase (luciferase family)
VIAESIAEAKLCDELGVEVLWLAEHHFDGNCAYGPGDLCRCRAFAHQAHKSWLCGGAGFAASPDAAGGAMSPLDNLSGGRVIVGLGRGTAYNVYEYQGYGIPAEEALERYEEAEGIMLKAWTSPDGFQHQGKFWDLKRCCRGCARCPHQAASLCHPRCIQRRWRAASGAAWPAVFDECANRWR